MPDKAYAFSNRKSTGSKSLGCREATAPPSRAKLCRPIVISVEDGRTNAYDDDVTDEAMMTTITESVRGECLIILERRRTV